MISAKTVSCGVLAWWLVAGLGGWATPALSQEPSVEEAEGPAEAEPEAADATPLALGQATSGEIVFSAQQWQTYAVEVPADAMVLTIKVEDSAVDLDLYARHGAPMDNYEQDPDYEATSRRYNDEIKISRSSDPPLLPGTYYIDVTYTLGTQPRIGKRRVERLPFTITASVIQARVDGELTPRRAITSQTDQETGWFRTYAVDVPRGARALRIDLDDVSGDLDIVARHGQPALDLEEADHQSDSVLGRETLLIDASSDPPLAPGRWYIQIYDPFELNLVHFTAYTRFESTPPPELLAIPPIRESRGGLDRAMLATVEVLTRTGTGSGTLLSPDGWVLTNHHVVESDSGGVVGSDELVISLCLDPKLPPAELFRGSVVFDDADLDLALVKIESGLYDQPLPAGYRFPYLELGDPNGVSIGDPITLLGFPGVGGLGSRATLSLTRGVVAGFDRTEVGLVLKTDAEIGAGNSGGAALDAAWRLIAVPVGTVEDAEGYSQLGYLLPINLLPAQWRQKVGQ